MPSTDIYVGKDLLLFTESLLSAAPLKSFGMKCQLLDVEERSSFSI